MDIVIDTSVLIGAERARQALPAALAPYLDAPAAISAITVAELLHGVHRAATPDQQARRRAFVDAVLAACPVLEFGLAAAEAYAEVWATLAAAGQPIDTHDLLIGATALAERAAVLTSNPRDFRRIPGLTVLAWTPESP